MTRRLILIRHAKSSRTDPSLADIDRPLNPRGQRSAPAVGQWLDETGYLPERILCSPAARTRETCELLGLEAPVVDVAELYEADPEMLWALLRKAEGETVAMIGHNPAFAEFAAELVAAPPPHGRFTDFPTCATLVADFPVDDWSQIAPGTAQVVNFITPRELIGD